MKIERHKKIDTSIVHIITGLGDGGAEKTLTSLVTSPSSFSHVVISLMNEGKYGQQLRQKGIRVHSLGIKRGANPSPQHFWALLRLIRGYRPQLIMSWLYHADLVTVSLKVFFPSIRIFWNVRNEVPSATEQRRTRIVALILAFFSAWVPEKVVYCAHSARASHERLGYCQTKAVVIPNGLDLPDRKSAAEKARLHSARPIVIGNIARFDYTKDHRTLLRALNILRERGLDFVCELAGTGIDNSNKVLCKWICDFGLFDRVNLLGQVPGSGTVLNGWDIFVLSSQSEAFPNVLLEAMAHGVPCVATNAGDSSVIMASSNFLVPTANSLLLANAIETIILMTPDERELYGNSLRSRVALEYTLCKMVGDYDQLFSAVGR